MGKNTYAVPALIEALDDPEPWIRSNAGHVFAQDRNRHGVRIQGRQTGLGRPEGEIGPITKVVVPALDKLLKDADPSVRALGGQFLGTHGPVGEGRDSRSDSFRRCRFFQSQGTAAKDRVNGPIPESELTFGIQALGFASARPPQPPYRCSRR